MGSIKTVSFERMGDSLRKDWPTPRNRPVETERQHEKHTKKKTLPDTISKVSLSITALSSRKGPYELRWQ